MERLGSNGTSETIGIADDVVLVVAGGGGGPSYTGTVDGTSGWAMPADASEWTSLLTGTGIANPTQLWLMQEASGSLADSIGSATLGVVGSWSYQQTVSGWSRKGLVPGVGGANYAYNAVDTGLSTGATPTTLLVICAITSTPGGDRMVALVGDSNGQKLIAAVSDGDTVPKLMVNGGSTPVSAHGVNDLGATVHPWVASTDGTPTYNDLQDDLETVSPAATTCLSSLKVTWFGGVVEVAPAIQYLYAAQWTGTAMGSSDRAALIALIKNGH